MCPQLWVKARILLCYVELLSFHTQSLPVNCLLCRLHYVCLSSMCCMFLPIISVENLAQQRQTQLHTF